MTPEEAIEAVERVSDMLDDGQLVRMADAVKLRAALPTLRRLAEERREAVESLRSIGLVLSPSGCRTLDEMLRDMGYACDTARAFLRRVEEGGGKCPTCHGKGRVKVPPFDSLDTGVYGCPDCGPWTNKDCEAYRYVRKHCDKHAEMRRLGLVEDEGGTT